MTERAGGGVGRSLTRGEMQGDSVKGKGYRRLSLSHYTLSLECSLSHTTLSLS